MWDWHLNLRIHMSRPYQEELVLLTQVTPNAQLGSNLLDVHVWKANSLCLPTYQP